MMDTSENEILKYFQSSNLNNDQTEKYIQLLQKLNKKIELSERNFNNLSNSEKKKIYPYLVENNEFKKISVNFLTDVNSFKDKYLLSQDEMKYFYDKIEELYKDIDILNNHFIDPFNFSRFSSIDNLNNIKYLFKNDNKENRNFDYLKNHKTVEKLGIYILPKSASPGFKNFRKIIKLLKKMFNIYLFIDDSESSMDACDLVFFDDVAEIHYVNNLDDTKLDELIYEKKLTLFVYIYGLYKRKNVVKSKPAPIQISFQEPPVIYPNYIYDYNLIDINLYNSLIKYANIDENLYKFITLKKNFVLPMPYYSNTLQITNPEYNPECIRIGIIAYSPKISHDLIKLIKEIIKINPNIYVTLYGYVNKEWIDSLFNSKQVIHDTYNNTYPDKLLGNILYIDSVSYNNHSTALEILKLKRPFIGYLNKKRYHGCFSDSLIKFLGMEKYFLADNIEDYVKLIKLYTYNKYVYERLYHKFIKKLNKSKILTDNNFVNDFKDTLNDFYDDYRNTQNFNN